MMFIFADVNSFIKKAYNNEVTSFSLYLIS